MYFTDFQLECKRAGQARPCRASDEGPEARRAFEVGPRAVLKIAKISEIMAKLGGFLKTAAPVSFYKV